MFCVVVEGDDPAPVFCALVLFRSQWGKEKESITSDKIFAVVDTDRESDPLSCSFSGKSRFQTGILAGVPDPRPRPFQKNEKTLR